jgi:putative oxidoreductase
VWSLTPDSDRGLNIASARDALAAAHRHWASVHGARNRQAAGLPAGLPFIDQMPPGVLYFTGTMELIGGLLITIGLFTRPVAFILSGFMAVGYFLVHFPQSFFPAKNYGEPAVLFCFVFLYLAAFGSWP